MISCKRRIAGVLICTLAASTIFSFWGSFESKAAKKPKLTVKKITCTVGQTKKIKVKNARNSKIRWQTKSRKIVKINKSGKYAATIKGLKKGSTSIICKVKLGGKNYKLTCKINVKKPIASHKSPVSPVKPVQSVSPVASAAPVPSASVAVVPTSTPDSNSILKAYEHIFPNMGVCVNYQGNGEGAKVQLTSEESLNFVTKQFNSISLENEMKPVSVIGFFPNKLSKEQAKEKGYVLPANYTETYVPELNFETLDKVLEIAYKNNLKLRGHTLIWHQQTSMQFFTVNYDFNWDNPKVVTPEVMDARMEFYIRTVMEHLIQKEIELTGEAGSIVYTWDIANEYLHRKNDPYPVSWEDVYGDQGLEPDYVKAAFEIAYDVLKKHGVEKKVSLVYNDYNTYEEVNDIISLINFINDDEPEIICAGIGMQSHMTLAYPTVRVYEKAINAFAREGYEIQITEMDIGFDKTLGKTEEDQAEFYQNIMESLVKAKKNGANITGVTIWGIIDTASWRAETTPLLFSDSIYNPKPAFYSFLEAAKAWE